MTERRRDARLDRAPLGRNLTGFRLDGGSAFTSSHWIWNECVRLTALTGLRYATEPEKGPEILKQQEDWMIKLGSMTAKAA